MRRRPAISVEMQPDRVRRRKNSPDNRIDVPSSGHRIDVGTRKPNRRSRFEFGYQGRAERAMINRHIPQCWRRADVVGVGQY